MSKTLDGFIAKDVQLYAGLIDVPGFTWGDLRRLKSEVDAREAELAAENARLREALRNLTPWCVTDVLEHCDGNKCRELWCAGCFGEDQAEANVVRAREALKAARNALGEG